MLPSAAGGGPSSRQLTSADEVASGKGPAVREFGGWTDHNYRLADGVCSTATGVFDLAERRIRRALQVVADHAARPLEQLRILDLGSYEGGFAIELAQHGARVVALEAREERVARIRFAAGALGLANLEVVHRDARTITSSDLGTFDVILCLGLLSYLPADDLMPFLSTLAAMCEHQAIVETQVSLYRQRALRVGGRTYHGQGFREESQFHGAAIDSYESFWPTQPSLVNMLTDAGFTSVSESLSPFVARLADFTDHVTLIAMKGSATTLTSMPEMNRLPGESWRWPEQTRRRARPTRSRK